VESHNGWKKDIEETQGQAFNFPSSADPDKKVADLYDMIHPNANDTLTVRSVFIIGPDKKASCPSRTRRPPAATSTRVLRVLDSLPADGRLPVATPVNWQDGQDVIIVPAVPTKTPRPSSQGLEGPEAVSAGDQATHKVIVVN